MKVIIWELQYVPTKERVVFGSYSLCQNKLNTILNKKGYKIIPFKK